MLPDWEGYEEVYVFPFLFYSVPLVEGGRAERRVGTCLVPFVLALCAVATVGWCSPLPPSASCGALGPTGGLHSEPDSLHRA